MYPPHASRNKAVSRAIKHPAGASYSYEKAAATVAGGSNDPKSSLVTFHHRPAQLRN